MEQEVRRPRCQAPFPLVVKHPCQLTRVVYYTCPGSRYGKSSLEQDEPLVTRLRTILPADERERGPTASSAPGPRNAGSSRAPRCGSCCARGVGCIPEEIEIEVAEHGKPFVRDTGLHFNLSHSGDRALIALSEALEVGVDVERPGRNVAAVERTLSDGERASGDDLAADLVPQGGVGEGDGRRPRLGARALRHDAPDGHALVDLDPGHGYVGALAVAGERVDVETYKLTLEQTAGAARALRSRAVRDGIEINEGRTGAGCS